MIAAIADHLPSSPATWADRATAPLTSIGRRRRQPSALGRLRERTSTVVAPIRSHVIDTVRDQVDERRRPTGLRRLATQVRANAAASNHSLWSTSSRYSMLSISSIASAGSAVSLFSIGSVLSIGSTGSILSIGSVGSVLSIGSAGSVLGIGRAGNGDRRDDRPGAPVTDLSGAGRASARLLTNTANVVATLAVVAAAIDS